MKRSRWFALLGVVIAALAACTVFRPADAPVEKLQITGLREPVEILRDRWGVPHIYAQTSDDLFFAQGYIAARDRLFQIDLWRRIGTGELAEVLGSGAVSRDRLARAVRFRGDWAAEWESYAPDAKQIATAFANGINAYIRGLDGKRPLEFRLAGYDPGLWEAEDCAARVAGLLMVRNLPREVQRSRDTAEFGLPALTRYLAPDPPVSLRVPAGLNLGDITPDILEVYRDVLSPVRFRAEEGSNNWAVDGTLTKTGKPLMASDPHRPLQIPSLRKTVHLVGPGWNAIGAGEPALPGIALGHNEHIAWGFTIAGIDQADLYVEELNPANAGEYRYKGAWRKFDLEEAKITVKGQTSPQVVELKYSIHGPVIHEDRVRNRAYALKWVGAEPGTAGYLASLSMARARSWAEFLESAARFKVPSQNMVYADRDGNIGWQVVGLAPVRKGWHGLFPVPGASGAYEWTGFLPPSELPRLFNPPNHFVATANHNMLPSGYRHPIGYEFAAPFRHQRVVEMLESGGKFDIGDFERMQQDVVSIPARRFQGVLKKWQPDAGSRAARVHEMLLSWDASLDAESREAMIYEAWIAKLPEAVFGPRLGARVDLVTLLAELEKEPRSAALENALKAALAGLEKDFGADMDQWTWGRAHTLRFQHVLREERFNRGPMPRPGDGNTVNSTSGPGFRQANGASYRHIADLSDWDRSVMTNTPGESGDPDSPHYADLLEDWSKGKYHPMPFSRAAVEGATTERILLEPVK
ncbi:MAG TPA: penicillin acylase family protein [Bryobacteraceae bacterium]|nr:penicillin acylase family protein [Bryobacteraceae bacterium]